MIIRMNDKMVGLVFIILGALLLFLGEGIFGILFQIVGALLIALGIFGIIKYQAKWNLANNIVYIVLGALFFFLNSAISNLTINVVLYLMLAYYIFQFIIRLRVYSSYYKTVSGIINLLFIVIFLVLCFVDGSVSFIVQMFGVGLIVAGLGSFISYK